jgi:hypothetical protein
MLRNTSPLNELCGGKTNIQADNFPLSIFFLHSIYALKNFRLLTMYLRYLSVFSGIIYIFRKRRYPFNPYFVLDRYLCTLSDCHMVSRINIP